MWPLVLSFVTIVVIYWSESRFIYFLFTPDICLSLALFQYGTRKVLLTFLQTISLTTVDSVTSVTKQSAAALIHMFV